jgi:carbamoyl-phosphate synthase large subunit
MIEGGAGSACGANTDDRATDRTSRAQPAGDRPAILLTGVGKRYDIVACFAALTKTIAADPNPLAPAQYAAHVRTVVPRIDDPDYVPALQELCAQHGVGAVIPLTDLDIEVLAHARASGRLPALVPSPEVARATYDKYEAHLLLERLGLPSPPTVLPEEEPDRYPVMIKPRQGSGARSIHLARDRDEKDFFVRYVSEGRPGYEAEPVMVQRAMGGPELSIDCLGNLDGRCVNAIPRTMLESRGGESIKGAVVRDEELIELGRRTMEALHVRGPATIQVFRDPEIGLGITDVNTRFGGAFPAPVYAALPGRSYPELIVRMAAGEHVEPHVGEFREGRTFTRYYWQLELDERLCPTGREIVAGGLPAPREEEHPASHEEHAAPHTQAPG